MRIWDWVRRNCGSSCLGRRKRFSTGAARDTGRERKISLLHILPYPFFFHMCWCITWHSYLFHCLDLDLVTASLSSTSGGYWYTHCCPFHLHFSCLKTLCLFFWNVKKMSPEACGSLGLLQGKGGALQMVETASSIQYIRRLCYCVLLLQLLYPFSARWSNFEHTLAFTLQGWPFVFSFI